MQEASGKSTTPNTARTISCKAWNSPAEYPNWEARCDIKGSDGTMLNLIFWKKVPGQTILGGGRLQNTKYLLVSKFCSKKIPKVTSILVLDYLSESKKQLVNQRKQKEAFNPGTAHSLDVQSYRMWWGAASPKRNDTPVGKRTVMIFILASRSDILSPNNGSGYVSPHWFG